MNSIEAFSHFFPGIAAQETRSYVLETHTGKLAPGTYFFTDAYCTDKECDCRVGYITVIKEGAPSKELARITFGWEPLSFYCRWMGVSIPDAEIIALKGPALMWLAPQTPAANELLSVFGQAVSNDPGYVHLLKNHYTIFKEKT
ncbi:MAG: hypothetical protein V4539_04080 [Bacteroidota bacterium]